MKLIFLLYLVFLAEFLLYISVSPTYIWSRKKRHETSGQGGSCIGEECFNVTVSVFRNGDFASFRPMVLSKQECASNQDLGEIICPKLGVQATCSLFSTLGTRTTSCTDLYQDSNVFVVPRGRLFQIPTHGVGYVSELDHIPSPVRGKRIQLETLSVNPRIFRLLNFISNAEADALVAAAKASGLQRSTVGNAFSTTSDTTLSQLRTSDTGFVSDLDEAMAIKRRFFDMLGIFPFQEAYSDGFQVFRYNTTGGYVPHIDWIDPIDSNGTRAAKRKTSQNEATDEDYIHDYDSSKKGTNRYATLLLFLNDVPEGGELMFSQLEPLPLNHRKYSRPFNGQSTPVVVPEPRRQGIYPEIATLASINAAMEHAKLPDYAKGKIKMQPPPPIPTSVLQNIVAGAPLSYTDMDAIRDFAAKKLADASAYANSNGWAIGDNDARHIVSEALGDFVVNEEEGCHDEEICGGIIIPNEKDVPSLYDQTTAFPGSISPHDGRGIPAPPTSKSIPSTPRATSSSRSGTSNTLTYKQAVDLTKKQINRLNLTSKFPEGSWEREMTAICKMQLTIKPRKLDAILFYNQNPDGTVNTMTEHGSCPVLSGIKWSANLWAWNGPRNGYWKKNRQTGEYEKPIAISVSASFEAKDIYGAELFWENTKWDDLQPGRPVKVNSYTGHIWNVKVDGITVITWHIDASRSSQRFVVTPEDLPPQLLDRIKK